MQLVFIGAVSWSCETECWLCFVVILFRMLFMFAGNSEQLHSRRKKGEKDEEWLHEFDQLINLEESLRGVWLWSRHLDPSGPQFNYIRKKGLLGLLSEAPFLFLWKGVTGWVLEGQEEGRESKFWCHNLKGSIYHLFHSHCPPNWGSSVPCLSWCHRPLECFTISISAMVPTFLKSLVNF